MNNTLLFQILNEITIMENLFGESYKKCMKILGRFIRIEFLNKDDFFIGILGANLSGANLAFSNLNEILCISDNKMEQELIFLYIEWFEKKYSSLLQGEYYDNWGKTKLNFNKCIFDNLIEMHWKTINPYKHSQYFKEKNLLEILDDFFENIVYGNEEIFYLPLSEVRYLRRGANVKDADYDRLLPNPNYTSLNRWNPKNQCFVYAALDDANIFSKKYNISNSEMVCLQELRASVGKDYSICTLLVNPESESEFNIFNMYYKNISLEQIYEEFEQEIETVIMDKIQEILDFMEGKNIEKLNLESLKSPKLKTMGSIDTEKICKRYIGKIFLKHISDNIFIPLNQEQDNDELKKQEAYGAFHVLVKYLQDKGFDGILFPSTRAELIEAEGKNIVLFNYQIVQPIDGTMKYLKFLGY